MSYEYYSNLPDVARARYDRKLALVNLKECPYMLPAGAWFNDPTKWPEVEWGDVYSYLIDTPGVFTRESMKNYKSLDAHNYFRSGWVHTVLCYTPDNCTIMILKADVTPSQCTSDDPHHPWVAVCNIGTVSAAHCDCMAGLGESCSHVGALLFKLEAAVRLGYTKRACTDEPCRWNQDFVKNVEPAPIAQISFYKDASIARAKKRKRTIREHSPPREDDKQYILSALSKCEATPVTLSTFVGYSDPFHWKVKVPRAPQIPTPLRILYNPDVIDFDNAMIDSVMKRLELSREQIDFICKSTVGQSESLVWSEQRAGRITASNVHRVLKTDQNNPAQSVVLGVTTEARDIHSKAIKWGKEHEMTAIHDYEKVMRPKHKDLIVNKTGLLISYEHPFLGASADSIVTCSCHGKRVVEVKCPFSHRDSSFQQFVADKLSCLSVEGGIHLKDTHAYYSQVQTQMFVYNVPVCDLFVWTPKFVSVVHVARNDECIQNILTTVTSFYMSHILPELVTRKVENSRNTQKENSPPKLYCICKQPESGKMIGCDNPTCPITWFHMTCMKLKRGPKHSWYCKDCRKCAKK